MEYYKIPESSRDDNSHSCET